MKKIKLFTLLLACTVFISCLNPALASAAVKLNATALTLTEGTSRTLKLSGKKKPIKWSSSNTNIATVTTKGKVTAIKSGSTTITATAAKKTYSCKVIVQPITITCSIPSEFYHSDDELNTSILDLLDIKKIKDAKQSVTLTVTKSSYKRLKQALQGAIHSCMQELVNDSGAFSEISVDDDYTAYDFYIDSDNYTDENEEVIQTLTLLTLYYQVYTQVPLEEVDAVFTFYDGTTNEEIDSFHMSDE